MIYRGVRCQEQETEDVAAAVQAYRDSGMRIVLGLRVFDDDFGDIFPADRPLPPDLAWYYLGRIKGGKVLGFLCRLSLEPDSCVRDTENLFHRYGPRGLLLAKFIPGFNTLAPPLAGIVGMAATTFALYDFAGTLIWAAISAGVGALFSNQLEQLVGLLDQAGGLAVRGVAHRPDGIHRL